MNACFYVGPGSTEWCWKYFPTKSPGELPIAGKSWCRHLVDQCSRLKINDIFIADCYFHDDLTVGMGAGDYWSLRLHYLPSIPCPQPERIRDTAHFRKSHLPVQPQRPFIVLKHS